ncbi:MAG: hypothetical protein WA655_20555 [Candidatus Korobacteraceae bacterium]
MKTTITSILTTTRPTQAASTPTSTRMMRRLTPILTITTNTIPMVTRVSASLPLLTFSSRPSTF